MDYKDENQNKDFSGYSNEQESIDEQPLSDNQHIRDESQNNADTGTTETYIASKERNKPPKNKSALHFILGGLSGGIVSVVLIVALVLTNVIPLNQQGNNGNTASDNGNKTADVIKTLASDDANVATNIEETSQAVVGVINMQQQSVWTESQEAGTGSGIIYKKENGKAYIITNQHVVAGAKEVEIALNYEEERLNATVLGTDELTDLAVLEVDGDKITTVANMGSSKDLKVGETVMAIGNPLGMEFANTVTKGVVSGLNRSIDIDTNGDRQPDWVTEVIQTDAAINPGNSGGALVNENGAVIGINSMKIARQEVEGIGFAIPVDTALPILEQLEKDGEIKRPLIGISTAALSQVPPQYRSEIALPEDVKGGMVVADVQNGSAADKAGLQQFDVITKINGNEITSILELRQFLYSDATVGEKVEIEYYRGGKKQTVELTLQAQENNTENATNQ
ncbi:MAG: S1C family serine protease [Bacillota bacterium]|uniref:S1C family serine protease n=1 Tax=Virgibacillus TaxID=84406 RepID=UPI0003FC469D|nr:MULTISPECIES: trypsin-like peptidase domain-containing protein [Bacillaceae]MCC2252597.1 trypsin-like peptidase domain-containing protein [Virgibacillus sp. AGTR]MDY7046609.1 trypsin-like peptidase domain-containing protein [Virgibacillus sp. M23]QRZ19636.1 trypsin-like peptidase domain-containing protein [Virgibacillus sp. AGTR]WBX80702.1 trypsin-like peptidase domain-containing protein [Virgibacillus salarius]